MMMEPKIRFKGFSGEWETNNLNDLTDSICSGKDVAHEGTYPLYGSTGIIGTTDKPSHDGSMLLVARVGANAGKLQLINEECGISDNTLIIKSNGKISDEYLFYYFKHFNLNRLVYGSGQPLITGGMLRTMSVRYGRKEERKKIASFFTSLDNQISAAEKRLASLKQVKAASLQAMFPQEGETTPKLRFKGCEGEWEKVKLGECGTTYSGITGKSKEDFGVGSSKYITFLNVLTNAQIDTTILEPVNIKRGEGQNSVQCGDLLFNTSSETPEEVGMCSVVNKPLKDVYLNSFCFGYRLSNSDIDPNCLAYMLRGPIGRKIMGYLAQGATRYNLSKSGFNKIEVLIPSLPEQRLIASYFTSLDRQISAQSSKISKLKQIKSACLDQMFV